MTSDWACPDRTGKRPNSGAEIISIDQVVEAEDGLAVEQDGVDSMRDIEAEANDEQGLRDRSIIDRDENTARPEARPHRAARPELD